MEKVVGYNIPRLILGLEAVHIFSNKTGYD